MTSTQQSILSIIEGITSEHDSFETLAEDPRYQIWMRHVNDMPGVERSIVRMYKKREKEREAELAKIPRYF